MSQKRTKPNIPQPDLPSMSIPSSLPDPAQPLAGQLRRMLPSGSPTSVSTEYFSVPMALAGSPAQWASGLADLGFSSLSQTRDGLSLELAEALDLHGRPHQFIRLRLSRKGAEAEYTRRADQHPAVRRLQAWHLLLLTLSACGAMPASHEFGRHLSQALSDALALVSEDSQAMRMQLEASAKQLKELQARIRPMEAQREADAKRVLLDAQSIQSLQARIRHLEHLPDSVLEEELMEWLRAHDGSMSVREVARSLGVGGQRVEDALDKLCKAGRIQRVK